MDISVCLSFLQNIIDTSSVTYGTFNTHRSGLALIHPGILSDNPIISRFMKGIKRLRPPQPRYDSTWNPESVLNYIQDLPENSQLSLKMLSFKLVTLLALITAQRVQTISLIRIRNIRAFESGFEIKITDCIKTSLTMEKQPCLKIPYYTASANLCVASTLNEYLIRTAAMRDNNREDFLFLTFRKPHRRASVQSLSRWIKSTLSLGGIDTDVFKSHSTRHAATSAANRQGISIDNIRRTAGWSKGSATFAKFYNRPLQDDTCFANCILDLVS